MRALILYNPTSGKGRFKKHLNLVKKSLIKNGYNNITIYESKYPKDLTIYIKNNLENTIYDILLVSGGDGTINEVINGIMCLKNKPPLMYIPSGTTNDLASILKLKKSIKKSVKIFNEQNIKTIDICRLNNDYFLYATACGKFSNVSYKVNKKRKKIFGYIHYIKNALLQIPNKVNIQATINNKKYNLFLMIGIKSTRLAKFKINNKPNKKLNSGKLDLVLFENKSYFSFINFILYCLTKGKYKKSIITLSNNNYQITLNQNQTFNVDGEQAENTNKVTIEVLQEQIKLYVPTKINNLF